MARACTSEDIFNAIAECKRREIIAELRAEPRAVGELASSLGMPQPALSKHLGVLRKVGVVNVIKDGRHRFYRLDARKLKPVFDWVGKYEEFWSNQIDRIKARAEQIAKNKQGEK